MLNAFRHAGARLIDTELQYERRGVTVTVRDDGGGLPPALLRGGSVPGHWGLPGMRERATRLGASLRWEAGAGTGTVVTLRLPAGLAYGPEAVLTAG